MADNRGVDTDPGWINRKLREIERAIADIRSERRAAATTVASGSFTVVDDTGAVVFRIGDMAFGDRGLTVRREGSGSEAFSVRKLTGGFAGQAVAINESSGAAVLSTDELLGGLRTPFFDYPFQPFSATTGTAVTCGPWGLERTTTSTTFESLFVYDGKRQNPFLNIKIAVRPSDTTTSAEVRVVNLATGNPLSSFFGGSWLGTVPTGAAAFTVLAPNSADMVAADAGLSQAFIRLAVQVRRSAGAGSLTVAVPQSIGG